MSDTSVRKPMYPLIPAQQDAVQPERNIWLSASAGTGKTQVLTARVIRLLLEEGVQPENLLCITFTKAGAAEMAERINQLLASWVQLGDQQLFHDLEAIGAKAGPAARKRASELFAKVLDAPGGGLQIMTIHSFCQSLLASFPEEAGLVPGAKPIEGPEQKELLRQALLSMIVAAEAAHDSDLIDSLQNLSLAMGEEATLNFLNKCAATPDTMAEIPDGPGAVIWARRLAEVSFDGSVDAMLEAALADEVIDSASIRAIADQNLAWGKGSLSSRGGKRAETLYDWLAMDSARRAQNFAILHGCWSKSDGEPLISSKNHTPLDDAYASLALELHNWTKSLHNQVTRAKYADRLAKALLVGKRFAQFYAQAKHERGVIDFDDMIRRTAALLSTSHMSDWVRYKLDRHVDHILVDEAQDTNKAQWDIINALSDDFFSGSGARAGRARTVFSVGDFKQAIYGFQGTAPERYQEAGELLSEKIEAANGILERLTLSQSFRSTPPILDFVNAVVATAGPSSFGIGDTIDDHYSDKPAVGMVKLLSPVTAAVADDNAANDNGDDEESWITGEKRLLAAKLADHVEALIEERPWLASQGRHLEPGDIMFLLRSRGELASLLVAQLHERNIPVAGIDRLRLTQPLVVQDLLAVIRFVLQPQDDLSLACILVSPIVGWTQEQLLQYGYRGDRRVSLWQHLREQEAIGPDMAPLRAMLEKADFVTVYDFLEDLLSGEAGARRKFAARMGSEVLVPIEELLNTALLFQQQHGGGLQSFLGWFDRGDIEIKREGEGRANEVRVMTVHGSKGLQAPVVILADTTSDPGKKPDHFAELLMDEGRRTPLLPIRVSEKSGRLAEVVEKQKKRELEEHHRLLYVAITRAEERLIMGGALGVNRKGEAPGDSWYSVLHRSMASLGCKWEADPRWGRVMRHIGADGAAGVPTVSTAQPKTEDEPQIAYPGWLSAPAPLESRPPRPLVPSRLDDDDYGDAPPSATMRAAAERGKLLHALFERVTDPTSLSAAARWLDTAARDPSIDKSELLAAVSAIVQNPEWAEFFGDAARAEVPLAAVVGETVVTGRVDRLIVEPDRVRVVDFKTGRAVPDDALGVIAPHLRQMAHYVAALGVIFPGRSIEASLLFTHAPRLISLPPEVLDPYKPAS
ncbi:MAG: double-strand break repair helicase AddA [Sphingomonadaceae bacterium]|nr:double-strand break repair helicase AddA [Sphingomonadaceae bacterium]